MNQVSGLIISRIPQLVHSNNLSLAELSRRTGLTQKTVVKLYYADFTHIHIEVLDKLCEVLDTTPGEIFQYSPGNRSKRPVLESLPEKNVHPRNVRASHVKLARKAKEKEE